MANSEFIVGLDIGTTKISAVVGKKNDSGKIDILGISSTPSDGVSRGVVVNIDRTVNAIKKVIKEVSDKSDLEIGVVHVGIAGQHISSMQQKSTIVRNESEEAISVRDTERLREDVKRLAMKPGEQIIHIIPQEYSVDNELGIRESPVGMSGIRLEGFFHIVTGQTAAVKNIYRCVQKAGLEVGQLILEPIASAHATLAEDEKEAGVVLVDIGGGTTDISIYKDGIIRHTAVIPLGGNIITEDIVQGCNVMKRDAEIMKTKFGSAMADKMRSHDVITIPGLKGREAKEISFKNLSYIIQARVEEIFEHLAFEIKASGFEKRLIAGVVVTGGGGLLRDLKPLVEYTTGMDARIGTPIEYLDKGMIDEVNNPKFATAVGLILCGVQQSEEINTVDSTESEDSPINKAEKGKKEGFFGNLFKKGMKFIGDSGEDFK